MTIKTLAAKVGLMVLLVLSAHAQNIIQICDLSVPKNCISWVAPASMTALTVNGTTPVASGALVSGNGMESEVGATASGMHLFTVGGVPTITGYASGSSTPVVINYLDSNLFYPSGGSGTGNIGNGGAI